MGEEDITDEIELRVLKLVVPTHVTIRDPLKRRKGTDRKPVKWDFLYGQPEELRTRFSRNQCGDVRGKITEIVWKRNKDERQEAELICDDEWNHAQTEGCLLYTSRCV